MRLTGAASIDISRWVVANSCAELAPALDFPHLNHSWARGAGDRGARRTTRGHGVRCSAARGVRLLPERGDPVRLVADREGADFEPARRSSRWTRIATHPGARRARPQERRPRPRRRRRPRPRQRHVPHRRAHEEDRHRHPRRHLDRPGHRPADRPPDALPVARNDVRRGPRRPAPATPATRAPTSSTCRGARRPRR